MNAKTQTQVTAESFLNYARQYFEAAVTLLDSKSNLNRPINFLFFHATELALKAYLRAHGRTPRRDHDIETFYNECRELGLKIGSDDRFGLQNIVSLLASGNEDMGFRYFSLESGSEAELTWTRPRQRQLAFAVEHLTNRTVCIPNFFFHQNTPYKRTRHVPSVSLQGLLESNISSA